MGIEPLAAVRALHIAATIAVAGAFAFRLFVLPRARDAERQGVDDPAATVVHWMTAWCGVALAIGLASWLAWLAVTASGMSGVPVSQAIDRDVLGTVLGRTTFGRIWTLRAVCMLALSACLVAMRRPNGRAARTAVAIATCLGAVLLATLSATGHAVAADPSERPARLAADALHALAAGAWLGALVPLLSTLNRAHAKAEPSWNAFAAVITRRFSGLGVVSMAVLLGSGLLNASWLAGSWNALGTTLYGRLVALKVALFGLILAIAAVNRLLLTPRLGVPATSHRAVRMLRSNVVAELGLGAIVIAVVGVLGATPPSVHRHSGGVHRMHVEGRPQVKPLPIAELAGALLATAHRMAAEVRTIGGYLGADAEMVRESRHTTVDGTGAVRKPGQRSSPPAKPPLGRQIKVPSSAYSSLGMSQHTGGT